MGKLLSLVLCCFAFDTVAYVPTIDLILSESAKRCIGTRVTLNGILRDDVSASFVNLAVVDENLTMVKKETIGTDEKQEAKQERVNLFLLQEFLNCSPSGGKRLKDYLAKINVDTEKVHHGFFGTHPVFIIGAEPADTKSPQVMIDKQTFLPMMEKTADYETSFLHWLPLNALSDKKWPSTMITIRDGRQTKLAMTEAVALPSPSPPPSTPRK